MNINKLSALIVLDGMLTDKFFDEININYKSLFYFLYYLHIHGMFEDIISKYYNKIELNKMREFTPGMWNELSDHWETVQKYLVKRTKF